MNQQIANYWATPILFEQLIPDVIGEGDNQEIESCILKDMENDPQGIQVTNVGGYHTKPGLLKRAVPLAGLEGIIRQRLVTYLQRCVAATDGIEMSVSSWAVVSRSGNYTLMHSHTKYELSFVYYVNPGEGDAESKYSGVLEFRDPRPAALHGKMQGFGFGDSQFIKPLTGLLLIFPSWLDHQAHPYTGEGQRIVISGNVSIKPLLK